jgi:hypothetical protein
MMMDPMSSIFQRGTAWHTFENLEKDLVEVTRYVALSPDNDATWSEKIAQLLLVTGSTVDSAFNEMRKSSLLPQTPDVVSLRSNPQPNIGNYRDVYEPMYQLSSVELEAQYGLSEYGTIKPFEPFSPGNSPRWWEIYNEVKHGFFQNMWKAQLHFLVYALGALFALNILHKDSQQHLLKRELIQMGNFSTRFVYWRDYNRGWDAMKNSFVGLHGDVSWDAWVASEIFLHRFRKDPTAKS